MAFRIHDVTLHLMPYNGGQPGGCTCGPASGNAPKPPGGGDKPPGGGGGGGGKPTKPSGTPKKRILTELRAQLRETVAPPM
jgi:hypothetical protein